MGRMSDSLSIIFGVVPEATRAWKPETAPHMMQMNRKGKIGPFMVGPPPRYFSFRGGAFRIGLATIRPATSRAMVPILRKLDR